MYKRRKKKRRKKTLIQIRSRKNRWTTCELLGWKCNNRMIVKLPSGQIVIRKATNMRFTVARRVTANGTAKKDSTLKMYKTKKKRKLLDKRKPSKKKKNYNNRSKNIREMQYRYRGNVVYGQRKKKK